MATEFFETVIVGGGQAGLATGYHLAEAEDGRSSSSMRASAWAIPGAGAGTRFASTRRRVTTRFRAAVSGEAHVVPDDPRDGRLPRVLRRRAPAAGALGDGGRHAGEGRRPVRPRRPATGRSRRRRSSSRRASCRSRTSRASRPSSTHRSGSSTRTTTATSSQLQEGSVLVVGASHSGADIASRRQPPPHDPVRRRHRADPGARRHASWAHGVQAAVLRRLAHPHHGYADRPEDAAARAARRGSAAAPQKEGAARGGGRADVCPDCRCAGRPARARRRARARRPKRRLVHRLPARLLVDRGPVRAWGRRLPGAVPGRRGLGAGAVLRRAPLPALVHLDADRGDRQRRGARRRASRVAAKKPGGPRHDRAVAGGRREWAPTRGARSRRPLLVWNGRAARLARKDSESRGARRARSIARLGCRPREAVAARKLQGGVSVRDSHGDARAGRR